MLQRSRNLKIKGQCLVADPYDHRASRGNDLEQSIPSVLEDVPAPIAFANRAGDLIFSNRALRQLTPSASSTALPSNSCINQWLATEDHPTMVEANTRFFQVRKINLGPPLGGSLHIGTDVTQLMTSKALYQVLTSVYRLITQGCDRSTLFSGAVEVLWQEVPVEMAWIGEVDAMDGKLNVVVTRSRNDALADYVEDRRVRLDDARDEVGPILRAIRLNRPDVVQDTLEDPGLEPFQDRYREMGIRSIAVCPIRRHGRVTNLLVTYGRHPNFFADEVVELLERVADGLSFGLDNYERAQALEHLAMTDAVTGLPNRVSFLDQLAETIKDCPPDGIRGVAYMDLDGFKTINDTYGHDAGDEVLRIVASRVQSSIGQSQVMGRLGGDEFCLLLREESLDAMAQVLDGALNAVQQPIVLNRHPVQLSASIGVAIFPYDADSPDLLLRLADIAMYQAKAAGKGRFRWFNDIFPNPGSDHNRSDHTLS